MARHGTPPFRADHVGSLLRPKRLLEARDKRKSGELPADALKAMEDEAIREVVKMQEEIGLHSVTDGDFRRDQWWVDFVKAIDGVAIEGGLPVKFRNAEGEIEFAPPKAVVKRRSEATRQIPCERHYGEPSSPCAAQGGAQRAGPKALTSGRAQHVPPLGDGGSRGATPERATADRRAMLERAGDLPGSHEVTEFHETRWPRGHTVSIRLHITMG